MGNDYLSKVPLTNFLRLSGASKVRTPDLIQKRPKIGHFRPKSASEENFTIFSAYYITRPFECDINQLYTTFSGFKSSHARFDKKGPKIGHFRPKSASYNFFSIFPAYYITRPFERDINQLSTTFRGFKSSHTRFDQKRAENRPFLAEIGLGGKCSYFFGILHHKSFRT